ncbi:MAG: alpha-hydroxy-acid oxidizing protein [Bryobacterales bacterium]|nr:alpha-hydroxy-acid oxidizing protein [Bryobacterales bacterium]
MSVTRRTVLQLAALPAAAQQSQLIGEAPGRITPVSEIVNAYEAEAMARRVLHPERFAEIAASSRAPFDRITFRPRLMVSSLDLDLSVDLFGVKLFAPIIAGPVADLAQFHAGGEAEWRKGAAAAKTQVMLPADFYSGDWAGYDEARKASKTPLLLKGILRPEDAKAAVDRGAPGIVVSRYRAGAPELPGVAATITALPAIADAVGGRIPILIDGGFARGTDVLKAIALGARAVLVARPLLWGLAAYGAPGVQQVLELIQSELARAMVMCGKPNIAAIGRDTVRLHKR